LQSFLFKVDEGEVTGATGSRQGKAPAPDLLLKQSVPTCAARFEAVWALRYSAAARG